jgi:hypothetical protein
MRQLIPSISDLTLLLRIERSHRFFTGSLRGFLVARYPIVCTGGLAVERIFHRRVPLAQPFESISIRNATPTRSFLAYRRSALRGPGESYSYVMIRIPHREGLTERDPLPYSIPRTAPQEVGGDEQRPADCLAMLLKPRRHVHRVAKIGDLASGMASSRCHTKSASGLRGTDFHAAATASRHVLIAAARSKRCD